jgi:predicted  nucleic acid-binding Zn-ribbon protein
MDNNIQKNVCDANMRRIEERMDRQDKSIDGLKKLYNSINDLTRSIDNLATETRYMRQEQTELKQSIKDLDCRIDLIERKPAKKWEDFIWYVFIAIVGAILGIIFMKIGLK